MLVSFLYIFLHPQNVCYTLFFGFRTGLGELVLYKIQSVADVHLNPIKWCRSNICPWWCLVRQDLLIVGPFHSAEGWLAGACLRHMEPQCRVKPIQPHVSCSCVFPICLSYIKHPSSHRVGSECWFPATWTAHTTVRSSLCVRMGGWGTWVRRKGAGCPVDSIPLESPPQLHHCPQTGCPTWPWGRSLLAYYESLVVTTPEMNPLTTHPKIGLDFIMQCTLNKYQCPWQF